MSVYCLFLYYCVLYLYLQVSYTRESNLILITSICLSVANENVFVRGFHKETSVPFVMKLYLCSIHDWESYGLTVTFVYLLGKNWGRINPTLVQRAVENVSLCNMLRTSFVFKRC